MRSRPRRVNDGIQVRRMYCNDYGKYIDLIGFNTFHLRNFRQMPRRPVDEADKRRRRGGSAQRTHRLADVGAFLAFRSEVSWTA